MTTALLRAALVVVIAALAGIAALAFSNQQPKEYASSLKFAFGRVVAPELSILGPNFGDPQIDENVRIQTEAALLASYDVAVATSRAAPGLGPPGYVSSHVSVTPVRDTLTATVVARSDTPEKAARLANTYGQQYLALRRQREAKRAKAVAKALKARLARLTSAEKKGVQGANLRAQISQEQTLGEVGSGEPQLFQTARPSLSAATPDTLRNVLFGVLFGLVVGIGLVALRVETTRRSSSSAKPAGRVPARGGAPPHL